MLDAAHLERARLVVVALPDAGATRVVVLNARRANPTVPILARAPRPDDEQVLRRSGATAVVAPELAGALLLLEESARTLDLTVKLPDLAARDGHGRRDGGATVGELRPA